MFREGLLVLLFSLPSILCSCFTQVPSTTSRHVLAIIDPCLSIGACENTCLGNSQAYIRSEFPVSTLPLFKCLAYAFVNMRCALLGVDSGRNQICTSLYPVCYERTTACDGEPYSFGMDSPTIIHGKAFWCMSEYARFYSEMLSQGDEEVTRL